jgi:hypothetical protein
MSVLHDFNDTPGISGAEITAIGDAPSLLPELQTAMEKHGVRIHAHRTKVDKGIILVFTETGDSFTLNSEEPQGQTERAMSRVLSDTTSPPLNDMWLEIYDIVCRDCQRGGVGLQSYEVTKEENAVQKLCELRKVYHKYQHPNMIDNIRDRENQLKKEKNLKRELEETQNQLLVANLGLGVAACNRIKDLGEIQNSSYFQGYLKEKTEDALEYGHYVCFLLVLVVAWLLAPV